MRHVLVIGGAGYVGSGLVGELLTRGDKVRVLDDLIYNNSASIAHFNEHPAFSFLKGDLCSAAVCTQALDGITDVVLLAALVGDPICKKYPELARKVNLEGPMQLFEIVKTKPIQKFIFTSTCSNYGLRSDDSPASEDAELNPVSLYAETKVAFEKFLLGQKCSNGPCPVILRLSTVFGISPRMRFDLTVSEFTKVLSTGEKLVVFDENTWRPYCHVSDVNQAIILALDSAENKVRNEVFNVGGSLGNFTKKMIVNVITEKLQGGDVEYKVGGGDPRNYKVAFEKINKVLGFSATHTVEDSVGALIKAVKAGFYADSGERRSFYGNYEIKI